MGGRLTNGNINININKDSNYVAIKWAPPRLVNYRVGDILQFCIQPTRVAIIYILQINKLLDLSYAISNLPAMGSAMASNLSTMGSAMAYVMGDASKQ